MKAFISYVHEDRDIAVAWKSLLTALMPREEVWFAEDPAPTGGLNFGKWRNQITEKLGYSDVILTLLTPNSIRREWVLWENGFFEGNGDNCLIAPVVYQLPFSQIHGTFSSNQMYKGDDRRAIERLLDQLLQAEVRSDRIVEYKSLDRNANLDMYFAQVKNAKESWNIAGMFEQDFHVDDTAKMLSGQWYAMWTEIDDAGSEFVFDRDKLTAMVTANRIRFVGVGRTNLPYPIEGIVSAVGKLALSYWSRPPLMYCGAIVLSLNAGSSDILTGEWMGHTAQEVNAVPCFLRGRAVMARDQSVAYDYWPVATR